MTVKLISGYSQRASVHITGALILLLLLIGLFFYRLFVPSFGELPDMKAIKHVPTLKREFFNYLSPIIAYHNNQIMEQRLRLLEIQQTTSDQKNLPRQDLRWLKKLAGDYRVDWNMEAFEEVINKLLNRVDIIPPSLVSVQAAKESGWGRSRYAINGNNLFGQWCFEEGCGLVPKRRPAGDIHEVERFDSVSEAVEAYLYNLNTHQKYKQLRSIRRSFRNRGETPKARALASGLLFYSERREAYVQEVKNMLHQYEKYAPQ